MKKKFKKGRNPHSGEELKITPRRVFTFRVNMQLKEEIEKLDA